MVRTIREWETVYFQAVKKGYNSVTIELSFNHKTNKYTLCTVNEESVSFKDDSIQTSRMKIEAITAAIKYVDNIINKKK
jgi:hypothetical protein